MNESDNSNDGTFERIAELLEFPADFPIKVMGSNNPQFLESIGTLVSAHVDGFDTASIVQAESRTGKFISLTVPVRVHSREQLQSLYEALADHELVRIVL